MERYVDAEMSYPAAAEAPMLAEVPELVLEARRMEGICGGAGAESGAIGPAGADLVGGSDPTRRRARVSFRRARPVPDRAEVSAEVSIDNPIFGCLARTAKHDHFPFFQRVPGRLPTHDRGRR